MGENDIRGILLESGTNEMEIVEFNVGQAVYGINVLKVREIISPLPLTVIPQNHPCLEGLIQLRGQVLPVINLAAFLGYGPSGNPGEEKLIVCEFNKLFLAFHVHSVERIHRISWEQIESPSTLVAGNQQNVIGVIKMEGRILLLLDFESIVYQINPSMAPKSKGLKDLTLKDRSKKHVMVVEDSVTLRGFLEEVLTIAGYQRLNFFTNGAEAWAYLEKLYNEQGKDVLADLHIMISDIEMPQMDGHHLTKRVKTHPVIKELPVILFSSLITPELMHKGEEVGADAQISKPDYLKLAEVMDRIAL